MPSVPIRIVSQPGVQRDGTLFDAQAYTAAEWCRFYRGRPTKIGGYREMSRNFNGVGRGMHVDAVNSFAYVHVGESNLLERMLIDMQTNTPTGVVDRTPSVFVANDDSLWQFDSEFDVGTNLNYLLAHAGQNLANIASDVAQPLYFGNTTDTARLVDVPSSDVSGGVVCLHPYAVIYGSDGYLAWSVAGNPTDFLGVGSGAARPTASKIVQGLPLRAGPGSAPAGLFWGLDTLSRLMFTGGASIFSFDTISAATSVLSSASIIEHNGTYFWASHGGFLAFNGVIQEVPNPYNHKWFYANINMQWAQKMFATKVPRWGEIWWCFPKGDSTECNHAIVLNYRDKFWYDTPLPGNGRSCGYYEQVYPFPLMTDAGLNSSSKYSLWQHEVGVNEVSGSSPQSLAVRSSFRTHQINIVSPTEGQAGQDKALSVSLVEPDFNQVGDMTLRLYGAANAADKNPSLLHTAPVVEPSDGAADQQPGLAVTNRLLQFEFESNVVDGNYEMGKVLAHVQPGDRRRTT